jgi:hypothetical protein
VSDAAHWSVRSALDREARELTAFLSLLVARERGGLLEVRARLARGGMAQQFHRAGRLREAADQVRRLGQRTDVYVGCAPRLRRAGDHSALGSVWALWVDCDGAESVSRLYAILPAPSVIVRSGTGENVHAYWSLLRPLSAQEAAAANRRLAEVVGADLRSADATRILRPPGTRNFKHEPPRAVTLECFKPARSFIVPELIGSRPGVAARGSVPLPSPVGESDPLRRIPPDVYVRVLTGRVAGRDRKVLCPLHDDRTPSLHVYETPEQGWYCFGCGRGGSIYDLAAAIYGLAPRGTAFLRLRALLNERFSAHVRRVA